MSWVDCQSTEAWAKARAEGRSIVLRLPFPPTVNHLYRATPVVRKRDGKTIATNRKTPEARAYVEMVGWCVLREKAAKRLTGALAVLVAVMPPDKRVRDVANLEKALIDAIVTAGVIVDDRHIKDSRMVFARSAYTGTYTTSGCEVSIRVLSPEEIAPLF